MAFSPRTVEPAYSNKWYLHTSYGGVNRCILRYNGTVLPNCTGYAWGRFSEIMGKACNLHTGNAGTWYGHTSDGYQRGKTPKLGAVACWSKPGAAGHVAIVEKINSDGSILISESGYSSSKRFWTSTRKGPNWYNSSYVFQGFIYNPATTTGGVSEQSNILDDFVNLAVSHVGEGGSWSYKTSGLSSGQPWCAAFVDACAKTVGIREVIIPHTYAAREMARQGVQKYGGTWINGPHLGNKKAVPQRGDLILFRWKKFSNVDWWYAQHVGIVKEVKNNRVYTVEGNSSNSTRLKDYSLSYECISGYMRPDWSKVEGFASSGYGYLGPLYNTESTREDAILREVGYVNSNYEPSIQASNIELSVINYTGLLSDLFDNFREKYGYMFSGTSEVDVNVDGISGNCKVVVQFFLGKGLNCAAAVGVAANIKQESNFNTAAIGDYGTSFGICQWHAGRGTKMKQFVGSDWKTDLTGQLEYLWYELESSYKSVMSTLRSVPNTLAGAKQAADVFVRKFEIPANVNQRSIERQAIAEQYWKKVVIQQV